MNTEKGYGFIKLDDGRLDVFFHVKALRLSGISRALKDGEPVKFKVAQGPKGLFAEKIILDNEGTDEIPQ